MPDQKLTDPKKRKRARMKARRTLRAALVQIEQLAALARALSDQLLELHEPEVTK